MTAASARGLFRATGKKSKPVVVQMLDGSLAKSDEGLEREANDFYPTPPEPTRALLHAEINRLRDFPLVWEPACGDGAMVREMEALGLAVVRSDLVDRGCGADITDFYEFTSGPKAIVTNPPFSECGWGNGKARWLKHALDVLEVDYMALLMNWGWPGAGGLAPFYAAHPPARVYLMRWKIDFTGQGAPPMLNAWFVWDKKHQGETVLRMLDRKDARQHELFGASA
ncbi:MAG: hypothetical protein P0Y65_05685 [Candidatus Devosia phytovorans]|uniref:SAM-dependent methyltransferase n=1 Tax=Candidatus Devosia phytovorans TaxID=3121372 RepID=A0AAJ5VX87_9HYPH|nr:hypothetical protein [Devosia sp.]WEK05746.1 MAG: hypothetical protein P0Y65_05685 [Devosia sp.]